MGVSDRGGVWEGSRAALSQCAGGERGVSRGPGVGLTSQLGVPGGSGPRRNLPGRGVGLWALWQSERRGERCRDALPSEAGERRQSTGGAAGGGGFSLNREEIAFCYFRAPHFVSQLSLILDFAVISFRLVGYQVATIAFYGHLAQGCVTHDLN